MINVTTEETLNDEDGESIAHKFLSQSEMIKDFEMRRQDLQLSEVIRENKFQFLLKYEKLRIKLFFFKIVFNVKSPSS